MCGTKKKAGKSRTAQHARYTTESVILVAPNHPSRTSTRPSLYRGEERTVNNLGHPAKPPSNLDHLLILQQRTFLAIVTPRWKNAATCSKSSSASTKHANPCKAGVGGGVGGGG